MAENARVHRQRQLREMMERDPFLTDEALASRLRVSVQTIRLDRLRLGIPELRERIRSVAARQYGPPRSLAPEEVFGEILDLEVGRGGLSRWQAESGHVIARSQVVRGHFLFAQANSLAVAAIDAERALTAKATVRFVRPVGAGATVIAKARVMGERHGYAWVRVWSQVGGEDVFAAEFLIQRSVEAIPGRAALEDRN